MNTGMCQQPPLLYWLNGSAEFSPPHQLGSDWFDSTRGDVLDYVSTLPNRDLELELLVHAVSDHSSRFSCTFGETVHSLDLGLACTHKVHGWTLNKWNGVSSDGQSTSAAAHKSSLPADKG